MPATSSRSVTLLRSGNRLVIDPTTPKIHTLVTPGLRYVERRHLHGAERFLRKKAGRPTFDEIEWECFGEDHKGRIATSYGFVDRVRAILEGAGYGTDVRWATKLEAAKQKERAETIYKPQWDRIAQLLEDGFKYRYKQKKALELIAGFESGRIDCPTGWGKGTVIRLACTLFPRAKIDVVTKRVPVLRTRLYPELAMNLPSVGIVGGGKKVKGKRVMCMTARSLHHARPDADFVFVDEGHEACADDFAHALGVYEHARMWMFSASWDMRLDNKDMRAEAMAGPIRLRVTYKEAADRGLVVPIEVFWGNVIMDVNPCGGLDGAAKKKAAYWRNEYRNTMIARDARRYASDVQTLITVETLEHALELKRLLPEFKVVYAGQTLSEPDRKWFKKNYPDVFKPMTAERKDKLTARFETGKLKKVIATPVWNVGVDFRHLEVLIRADGGGSPINDTQIPGRNSRFKRSEDVAAGARVKRVGVVHDYRDQFDRGCEQKARGREKSYEKNEWVQHRPGPASRSRLREMFNMGDKK